MHRLIGFFKKRKIILIAVLLIVVAAFAGKKIFSTSDTTQTTQQKSEAEVTRGTVTSGISASGKVETANFLPITTSVNGIVKQVFVKEGDTVTKGQKIMEITLNADGEESLAQAYGSYLSAKNSLASAKTGLLSDESAMINAQEAFDNEKESNSYQSHDERVSYKLAENAYQVAKNNYDQQQSSITQAQVSLNKAWLAYQAQSPIITAPDSGTVANILVVEGMDITNSLSERTSTSVASIKKPGTPIVSLNITELDINNVKVGQKVLINLNSVERKTFTGTVAGIDKIGAISGGVTNYTVIVRFDDSSDLVLPNMGADGQIVVEEKENVLMVPTSAVTSERQNTYVTVLENGTEKRVEVKIGISDGRNTEIISGLNEGDKVVVSSLPTTGFTEAQQQNQRGEFRGPGMFIR